MIESQWNISQQECYGEMKTWKEDDGVQTDGFVIHKKELKLYDSYLVQQTVSPSSHTSFCSNNALTLECFKLAMILTSPLKVTFDVQAVNNIKNRDF